MSDLISRKALLEELEAQDYYGGFLVRLITNAPAIEQGESVAYIHKHYLNEDKNALDWHKREHPQFEMISLYTAPPQSQTVKDALEKAARIVQAKIGHYYPTPLTDAVNEIRALIEKE